MAATRGQKLVILGALAGLAAWWLRARSNVSTNLGGTVTTGTIIDLDDLGGIGQTNYGRKIEDFATAIARAEGFYVNGSIPDRAHNPGDLKSPGWTYPGEVEGSTLGEGIAVFQSDGAGWNALYRQLYLIVTGGSSVYSLDDTIASMGVKWVGSHTEGNAWATNVASALGVSVNTSLVDALV